MLEPDPWAVASEARSASRWRRLAASWNSGPTQALIDAADPAQRSFVLDLAAGSGDPAIGIALRFSAARVVALDRSGAGLVTAQQVAQNLGIAERLWFIQADVHHLPLANSHFDRVTCRCGIMFFDETHALLQEPPSLKPLAECSSLPVPVLLRSRCGTPGFAPLKRSTLRLIESGQDRRVSCGNINKRSARYSSQCSK